MKFIRYSDKSNIKIVEVNYVLPTKYKRRIQEWDLILISILQIDRCTINTKAEEKVFRIQSLIFVLKILYKQEIQDFWLNTP